MDAGRQRLSLFSRAVICAVVFLVADKKASFFDPFRRAAVAQKNSKNQSL
jgi:hypothetical protein